MKQLTISVAAYNVEAYLDHLMKSIIDADVMDSLEVLIVNDGSRDHTAEIAMRYQEKYPQSVRLIDKPNGGHGSTINRGIEEATGRYFRALDGDDWVHSEHLAALVGKMDSIDSDIILSNYIKCYEDGRTEKPNEFPGLQEGETYSFDEIRLPEFRMRYHTVIYRTELLKKNRIRLDEHCFYVDAEFMLYPIPHVDTIHYSGECVYCYRVGNEGQSVSNASRMKNIDQSELVGKHLIDFFNVNRTRLSKEKTRYCINAIKVHCKWHENSLFLCKPCKEIRERFGYFDKYILANAPEVYERLGAESKVLSFMRRTGYYTYRLAVSYTKKRDERWQKKHENRK